MHIGTTPEYQRLILRDKGHDICELADNTKMLGYYSVASGMDIHIIDIYFVLIDTFAGHFP